MGWTRIVNLATGNPDDRYVNDETGEETTVVPIHLFVFQTLSQRCWFCSRSVDDAVHNLEEDDDGYRTRSV